MKKLALLVCAAILLPTMLFSCADTKIPGGDTDEDEPGKAGKVLYVSPDGSDEADGSEETPFATIKGAKDAVRALKAGEGLPDGGVTVYFKSGTYPVNSTLEFTAEDSGEEGKPIVYTAAPDAEVIFDGGVTIDPSAFVPASDDIKARIQNPEAAEALLEVDLTAVGCYNLDDSNEYTAAWYTDVYRQDLYVDNIKQQVARWPDEGFERAQRVFFDKESGAQFQIPAEKAELWKDCKTIRYFGCPLYDWSTVMVPESYVSVDSENSRVCVSSYIIDSMPAYLAAFYVFNILEELDIPGEYFWDVPANKLYYYPDGSLEGKKIRFSQFEGKWFVLEDSAYLTFDGFIFENGRSAIFGNNDANLFCDHITVKNCEFRCLSTNAAHFHGNNIEFLTNHLHELGGGGVYVTGGNLSTSEYCGALICDNLIHDWSQIYTVYNPGIQTNGAGFTVCHNELYNSPHQAIAFNSSDTVIEYNYIHNVCDQTSDAGAIYSGRRWDWRGNVVRYNYITDIYDKYNTRSTPLGVYFDDMLAGQTCYGNLVVNTGGCGIALCGGKELNCYNNVLVNTGSYPIDLDCRGLNWAQEHLIYPKGMWSSLKSHELTSKIHIYRFPQNLLIIENGDGSRWDRVDDPGNPSNITCTRNISYACRLKHFVMTDNLIDADGPEIYNGTFVNNFGYEAGDDPGFVDAENGDYRLREDSRVFRDIIGFEPIPIDKIGRLSGNDGAEK